MDWMRMPRCTRRRAVAPLLALALLFGAGRAFGAPPADPGWAQQWAPARIGASMAWDTSRGAGMTIGVVDTGADLDHEDLASKIVASTTCQATDGDPAACAGTGDDDNGHGTHVAGVAAAATDNGKGIAGMAPDARLLIAKSILHQPSGPPRTTIGDLNAGIRWVVDRGAKVVNLSVGGNVLLAATPGTTLREGIDYAWSKGAVVVLAAGNAQALGFGSAEYGNLPAIVVAATGPDDEVSVESSPTGTARWALAAPGGNSNNSNPRYADDRDRQVLSTFQGNTYALDEGTGVAAPHVAGAVALVLSRPGVTAQQAVDIVLRTANASVSCGENSPTCAGRLDAAAAVAATRPSGPTTTTTAASSTSTSAAGPTTTLQPPGTTTVPEAVTTSTTTPEISVPEPTERPTTSTTSDPEVAGPPDGNGRSGMGALAAFAGLALLGSGVWAALVARREGLPDLSSLPFAGKTDGGSDGGPPT